MKIAISWTKITILILSFLLITALVFIFYGYNLLKTEKEKLIKNQEESEKNINLLEKNISELKIENERMNNVLSDEQKKSIELEKIKEENEEKIDELEKLTTIDPELLKKYSKVYFLNENYAPPTLKEIDSEFLLKKDKPLEFLKKAQPFLKRMLKAAKEDGITLLVLSAYRSFDQQMALKNGYKTIYGAGTANQFSADQGYSEHQIGTAVDLTTPEIADTSESFEKTEAFKWLEENAYKYGFIMSYPRENIYYNYEPWHWRFVGEDLAEDLYDDDKYFYELDQREIDKYLIKIFD